MNKLKKIFLAVAISMLGVSVTNTALADEAAFREMIKLNGALDAQDVIEHPKLNADERFYYFKATTKSILEKDEDGNIVLLSVSNGKPVLLLIADTTKGVPKEKFPKTQEYGRNLYKYATANVALDKEYLVVGIYLDNQEEKGALYPIFLPFYIDTKNGEFNQTIDIESEKRKYKEEQELERLRAEEAKKEQQQAAPIQSEQDYCKQSFEEGNMVGMTECTEEELSKEDKRLNAEYKAVMSKLDPAQKKELRTKQRAWIKARDQKCKLEEDSGQAGMLNHVSCLNEWTKKRADELAAMR